MTAAQAQAADSPSHDADFAEKSAEIARAMPQWAQLAGGYKPEPSRNPSLPTLVGLFILILCFFVVLTSISLKDQKRERSVMASLEQTFSGEGSAPPDAAPDPSVKDTLGKLRSRIGSEVPLVSDVSPSIADALVLNLPRNLVFAGAGPELAPGLGRILKQALDAIKAGPADYAYEVEVGLSAPVLDEKAVAAGDAVAGALRAAGFANDAALVSLTPGSGDLVSLTVRLRPDARLAPAGRP